jgi:general secretion pathway protein A
VAFVLNPKVTAEELLATICDEFGLGCPEGATSVRTLAARINDYLLDAHDKGRRAVLVIEEAQNLTPEVLEQVRLLTNLETNQRKLLQVIMVGQPELREMLAKPQQRQLSQRITARYHLGPLSRGEVPEYLAYRLAAAGAGRNRLFPPATARKVYSLAKGVPRLINVICDRALLGTFVQEKEFVDVGTLKRAAREVLAGENNKRKKVRLCVEAAGALLLLCIALAALYHAPASKHWPFGNLRARTEAQRIDQGAAALTPASGGGGKAGAAYASLSRPEGISGRSTKEMAYRALFRQWHLPYDGEHGPPACDQARAAGLECLIGKDGVSTLLEMNRPAVLRLKDEGKGDYYALLTSLDEKKASFVLGDKARTVDIGEVAKRWSGHYLLLWRAPPGYRHSLRPGGRGPAVAWLEKQLALARGRPGPGGEQGVYDETVMTQVKEFQIAAGMAPDGVAGPMTILHLCNASPDNRDPVLRDGKGTR